MSGDFIGKPANLDPKLLAFARALSALPADDFWAAVQQAFTRIIGSTPADYLASDTYAQSYRHSSDSIVAAAIDISVSASTRSLLVSVAKALWTVQRMAADKPIARRAWAAAPLILPTGIFPLPTARMDLRAERNKQAEASRAASEARQKTLAQLATEIKNHRDAIKELLSAFEQTGVGASGAGAQKNGRGFQLPAVAESALSATTREALNTVGATAGFDVAKTITLLDKHASALAQQLYGRPPRTGVMVRIGDIFVPQAGFAGGAEPEPLALLTPGPCPPVPDTTIPDDTVTVPSTFGDARVLGIADLMVVEQKLSRYQLGEIAHIENVLRSEVRSRKFATTSTTETTQTTETETTELKEKDLSSTERFELQTESQTVVDENASREAGITIHASYGPSIDATANYNSSSSTSTQQSNQSASNYAREIVNKAVDRVQTRTLTRRTVTTTQSVSEVDRHAFDNKGGTEDIVGVYRFVDKVYTAQIINYGKRLMLEFLVPEPAAFLRYALTHKPLDDLDLVKPTPPGYCQADGTTFLPLQATDLDADKALYWSSQYGAQDVTPPPPLTVVASASKKAPDQLPKSEGDKFIGSDIFDVTIPDGYQTLTAIVNVYGETQQGAHRIVYQIQDLQGEYVEPTDDQQVFDLKMRSTPTVSVSINSNGFYNYEMLVTVFCTASDAKMQQWQLKTFASIMNAYNDLKSDYDQAVRNAKLQGADMVVSGTNPENNRITEQIELKKGCISLLTAQRFDLFDAVARNIAPYGYPEIDFAEAKAEGDYIRFFEESFEWNNMVYVFYPYFWGKKDDWITVAQIDDSDPLFERFLQAGAARVQVPVRWGFQTAMMSLLSHHRPWQGDGAVIVAGADGNGGDDTYLSVVDELKSQTGDNNVEGEGTLKLTKDSRVVTGNGTDFSADDVNRRLVVGVQTYVIKSVTNSSSITLTTAWTGESAEGVGYALGGKLVGQPWEITLPTNLVKLDNSLVFS